MIKFIKLSFVCVIAATAIVACRTYFEGDKVKFHSSPVFHSSHPDKDSIYFRPFGY